MPDPYRIFTGRSFSTTYDHTIREPVWEPLVSLSRLARERSELPHLHVDEFMYMACLRNRGKRIRIHLYKHIGTRRYINLDDAGHAYRYQPPDLDDLDDLDDAASGGRYRMYADPITAIRGLDLSQLQRPGPRVVEPQEEEDWSWLDGE